MRQAHSRLPVSAGAAVDFWGTEPHDFFQFPIKTITALLRLGRYSTVCGFAPCSRFYWELELQS